MASDREIRVGVSVRFTYRVETLRGVVKEDRGPIGIGGRRLYLIKFNLEPSNETFIELPAGQLSVEEAFEHRTVENR